MTSDSLRSPLRILPADSGCVIDCDTCTVRGDACADCVVSVMLGGPPDVVPEDEQRALGVLAGAGLVPPLQMTPPTPAGDAAPPAGGAGRVADTAPGAVRPDDLPAGGGRQDPHGSSGDSPGHSPGPPEAPGPPTKG